MERLTIGQLAELAQVPIETLRYYERQGLIAPPPRSVSNYRLYPEDAVRQVRFIKRAQALGFSLKDIKELCSILATPEARCSEIRQRAAAKIEAIEGKIDSLTAMKSALSKLVNECPGEGSLAECPILESLETMEVMP
jgi:MerR family copper efflux transcriptional regulator